MLISLESTNLVLETTLVPPKDLHTLAKEAERFFLSKMQESLNPQIEIYNKIREYNNEISDLEIVIEQSAHESIQIHAEVEQARINQLKRWVFDLEKQFNQLSPDFQMIKANRENVLNLLDKLEGLPTKPESSSETDLLEMDSPN